VLLRRPPRPKSPSPAPGTRGTSSTTSASILSGAPTTQIEEEGAEGEAASALGRRCSPSPRATTLSTSSGPCCRPPRGRGTSRPPRSPLLSPRSSPWTGPWSPPRPRRSASRRTAQRSRSAAAREAWRSSTCPARGGRPGPSSPRRRRLATPKDVNHRGDEARCRSGAGASGAAAATAAALALARARASPSSSARGGTPGVRTMPSLLPCLLLPLRPLLLRDPR
jgi:hypothetical protein